MDRKDLIRMIAVATGISLAAPALAAPKANHGQSAVEHSNTQGYLKSGNPKAAGGPENPGVGNPFNAY